MKQFLLFLFGLFLFAGTAGAQQLRLNLYGQYVFDDKFDSYYDFDSYYNGKVKGGFMWGGGLEYEVRPNYGVELLYLHQSTNAPTEYYLLGIQHANFDLNMNYIMLGGNRHFRRPGSIVEPTGGLMIGMNILDIKNPSNGRSDSAAKFAWGVRGGVNLFVTDNIAIKLHAMLLSTVQSVGGSFYFGTGGGGAGLSAYSSMFQFGLGGGITYAFGGSSATY